MSPALQWIVIFLSRVREGGLIEGVGVGAKEVTRARGASSKEEAPDDSRERCYWVMVIVIAVE